MVREKERQTDEPIVVELVRLAVVEVADLDPDVRAAMDALRERLGPALIGAARVREAA